MRKVTVNENEMVDFTDIFEEPTSIHMVPKSIQRIFERICGTNANDYRSIDEDDGQGQYKDYCHATSAQDDNSMYNETKSLVGANSPM